MTSLFLDKAKRSKKKAKRAKKKPPRTRLALSLVKGSDEGAVIRFGDVEVIAAPLSTTARQMNIKQGQEALARVKGEWSKPGVRLANAADVPRFYADPQRPGRIVREWKGERVSGLFDDTGFRTDG